MCDKFEIYPDQYLEVSELAMIIGFFRKEYDKTSAFHFIKRRELTMTLNVLQFIYSWVRAGKPETDLGESIFKEKRK